MKRCKLLEPSNEPARDQRRADRCVRRTTQPQVATRQVDTSENTIMLNPLQRHREHGDSYQNREQENSSRYAVVKHPMYVSVRRVDTRVNQHAPNHQQMYSYMHLAATAARNTPSQCQHQPCIRGVDATPVRPHVRESNLQQRSPQVHPVPIGQSQSQRLHIRHRYGDVHAAERCRSRVDGTVQHQPLNRYQQPTPDTRHHRTIPDHSRYTYRYGTTNTPA